MALKTNLRKPYMLPPEDRAVLTLEQRVLVLEDEAGQRHRRIRQLVRGYLVLVAAVAVAFWQIVGQQHLQDRFAVRNCVSSKEQAKIQRRFIARQEAQTQQLLASGITFGIPKAQLPTLIEQSRASEQEFLGELDELAFRSC